MAIIDLIQWTDQRPDEIIHRVPEQGSGEFVLGSQLVVREGQSAVFVRDGRALDTFAAGRHTLSTANIPLLVELVGIPFGGKSPFTAEVFFAALREFIGLKWGTVQPLVYRDPDFGMVRLRAFGTYSMQVADPQLFVKQLVGAQGSLTLAGVEDFLRSVIITEVTTLLGNAKTPLLDMAGMTLNLGNAARLALADDFERLGLRLLTFQIEAISAPEEVQQKIDERSGMAAVGDLGSYTQFQAAQAMRDAAQNTGEGGAGMGVGLGAGIAMGQAMADSFRQAGNASPTPNQPAATPVGTTVTCPACSTVIPAGSKFCPECGSPLEKTCASCGTANSAGSKFCSNCGNPLP